MDKKTFQSAMEDLQKAWKKFVEALVEALKPIIDWYHKNKYRFAIDEPVEDDGSGDWLYDHTLVDVDRLTDAVIRNLNVNHKTINRTELRSPAFRKSVRKSIKDEVEK